MITTDDQKEAAKMIAESPQLLTTPERAEVLAKEITEFFNARMRQRRDMLSDTDRYVRSGRRGK